MTHPLAVTLVRGARRVHDGCHQGCATGSEPDARWLAVADLVGDPRRLRGRLDAVGHEVGSRRADVQASLFLEAYAWRLALPLAAALVAEQRIALLAPAAADVPATGGRPTALRLPLGPLAGLAADAAAGHPAFRPVPPGELAPTLRAALVTHLRPLVTGLRSASGRPERALWRTVADRAATAFLHAGAAGGDPAAGERWAAGVLDGTPPLETTPRFADRDGRVHLRGGCCLWWRTAAATTCRTCPLRTAACVRRATGA